MQDPRTFRVASYNVRKAIGGDFRRDPARILAVVAGMDADIVALQEGDFRFGTRAPLFDAAEVRRRTGLIALDLSAGRPGLGWHGNVVLVSPRIRVVSTATRDLPGLEPRGMVTVELEVADRSVRLIAAHLGLLPRHRRRQAGLLMEAVDTSGPTPTIVLGDLNAWGRSPRSLAAIRDSMAEVVCGPSFSARRPIGTLDRIFCHGALSPVASGVRREAPAAIASDHLPIWADLKLG